MLIVDRESLVRPVRVMILLRKLGAFERRLRRRNLVLGEASEGAVEAPSD
jgi:hypothetical protein